jgi:hypothetical protein
MYFHEAEVVELGLAEELIQEDDSVFNTEGTSTSKVKRLTPVHVADAE